MSGQIGRPIKNPMHALARLRRTLSTTHHFTRKELAKKVGIPATSLRDIENGKYKMTQEIALKISYATGRVDPRSLLNGDDPLLDLMGQPLSEDSPAWSESLWLREERRELKEQLLFSLLDMAEEKKTSRLLDFIFETWLSETIEAFGSVDLFEKKLTARLNSFDPTLVPRELRPKNKKLAKEWSDFEYELDQEYVRLLDQYEADNPADPVFYSSVQVNAPTKDLLELEAKLKKKLRLQARENVARKRQEDAAKAATPKPVSGKRPRSSGRPAA